MLKLLADSDQAQYVLQYTSVVIIVVRPLLAEG